MNAQEENPIDKELRKKLENHRSEVSVGLWNDILSDIDKQDKAAGFWRWGLLAVIILIGGIYVYSLSTIASIDSSEKMEFVPQSEALVQPGQVEFENQSNVPNREYSKGEQTGTKQEELEVGVQGQAKVEKAESSATKTPEVKVPAVLSIELEPETTPIKTTVNTLPTTNRTIDHNESKSTGPWAKELLLVNRPTTLSTPTIYRMKTLGPDLPVFSARETNILVVGAVEDYVEVMQSSQGNKTDSLFLNDPIISRSIHWRIEASIGPSLNYRSFNASENPEFTDHKNNADRSLLSANESILLRAEIKGKWLISTGVSFVNMGERYEYTLHEETHEFKNKYNYVAIPIEIDRLIWSGNSPYSLYAGIGAEYLFLREGTSSWIDLASEQVVTHSNKGSESPFREHLIALNADISLNVSITSHWYFTASERGTWSLQSLYLKETGLDQKPFSFDTMIGLGFRF